MATSGIPATARHLCLAVVVSAATLCADAASLAADPVKVEMTPDARGAALTIRNDGDQPVVVQTRVMRWTQPDGKDKLEDTRDLLITPPVVEIAPRSAQVLRIGRRVASPAGQETTYRIIAREVLPSTETQRAGLHLAIELSVPLFVTDATVAPTKLEWTARRQGKALFVDGLNTGGRRARLSAVELIDAKGARVGGWSGVTYLLAGARRSFAFDLPANLAAGASLRFRVTSEKGTDEVALLVPGAAKR